MATDDKKTTTVNIATRPRRSSTDSSTLSVKTPRTARFAEATAVNSPIDPPASSKVAFDSIPTNHYLPQPQPSDIGFGYLGGHQSVEMEETDTRYLPPPTPKTPLRSPLKSALKSPGNAPRDFGNVLSPTFKEEQILEKEELETEKHQVKDLKSKTRVRMAKMVLRGVNFSCSLIVLSMLAATFTIFNATKSLAPRNQLPAWSPNTPMWPQITLIVIASISLLFSIIIFYAYFRGGHRRAEKVAVYYTTFAVAFFVFSIIMWGVGAAILQTSRNNNNSQDIWGWSCKDNKRKQLFQDEVSYDLVCRLQNWSLVCCIIEVVVEVFTITIYGIVFYRYYSKRQLHKSMQRRDTARSDLYLAQLRSQSAPNTPGFGPLSPRDGGWRAPPGHPGYNPNVPAAGSYNPNADDIEASAGADNDGGVQYAVKQPLQFAQPKPFALQAPPIRVQNATPRAPQGGFEHVPSRDNSPSPPLPPQSPGFMERQNDHVPAAPGETQYAAVPIPGSYQGGMVSPSYPPPR
ncbi:hypothetical protein K402DRAFT_395576 [Aulographum hederae CBS 113979]|uniref:MARVEL domain-containing protein n=1 Tax=Aulographum hederae CBS 113979 TaxID=1176131 RepID=A0A6G1GUZ1_9PEZI|nr:hypothetical protein K402DRAFT_395576 [Aulographum hederae CBS 113979]